MNIKQTLNHAVTAYDRKQADKAAKSPRAYYNHYALGQYLIRVDQVIEDIEAGAAIDAAIMAGFTPGPLRTACLKACGFAANHNEGKHGSYLGMPVYAPVTKS